jgi:hypothetical protein
MPLIDERKRDQEMSFAPSSYDETAINSPTGQGEVSGTIKDVVRLAGVSVATVSRVSYGAGNVSGLTRDSVLDAISSLKYSPSVHATICDERRAVV